LSCDPQSIVNQYQKYVTRLGDPAGYPSRFPQNPNPSVDANFVNLTVTDYGCRSTLTGSDLAKSSCSTLTRAPNIYDIVSLPAELVPQLRKAYVTRDSIKSMLSGIKDSQVDAICAMGVQVQGQAWRVACGTAASPENYMRVASNLSDPAGAHFTLPSEFRERNKIGATSFDWYVSQTACIDTATGTATSAANCQYLTSGANNYDILSVGAVQVPNLREIYFDEQEIKDAAPYVVTFNGQVVANVCNGSSVKLRAADRTEQTWTIRCGAPEDPANYERVPSQYTDPTDVHFSYGVPQKNDTSRDSFDLAVTSTICWDLATNKQATNSGKCTYLPEGASNYDLATISATYVPQLRSVYLDRSEVEALLPRGGTFKYSYYTRSVDQFCNGTATYQVKENGTYRAYTIYCGEPDSPDNYERYAYRFMDPVDIPSSAGIKRDVNNIQRSEIDLAVNIAYCWNLQTNTMATSSSKCTNLPTGASVYDFTTVAATYVRDLREVYVDRQDLAAIFAHGGDFLLDNNIRTLDQVCNGSSALRTKDGTATHAYTIRCGEPDDPANYERIAWYITDPAHWSYSGANMARNNVTRNEIDFVVRTAICWDLTTDKQSANGNKCTNLPTGTSQNDILTVPVTYVPQLREAYVNREDVQALISKGGGIYHGGGGPLSVDSFCNGGSHYTIRDGSSNIPYRMYCGTPDNPDRYERYAAVVADPYHYSATTADRSRNDTTRTSFDFHVTSTGCWDLQGNKAASPGKCTYLANGPQTYTPVTIPVRYDTATDEIFMKRSDLAAALPRGGAYTLYYANRTLDQACTGSQAVVVKEGTQNISYKIRCEN